MLLRLALLVVLLPVAVFALPAVISWLSPATDPAPGPVRAPASSPTALFPSSPVGTYPAIVITGRECARTGSGPVSAAAAGSAATTCEFAIATRAAYADVLATSVPTAQVPLSVWSAARRQDVALTCTGQQPVICRSSGGAVVYLYGGKADFSG